MKSWLGAKPFDSTYQFEERMQYRRLMGLGEVSVLGLGCTRLGSSPNLARALKGSR